MRILRNSSSRYPIVNGKASVELKLRTPRQLFDERDPAPFRERDLDDDAAQYILTSFREIDDPNKVKIALYFESMDDFKATPREIRDAIQAHFAFQTDIKRRELKDTLRHGFISLAIGLTFLGICAYFGHGTKRPSDLLGSMRYEAFFIMAWVSMWKPINTFLYEWWPIAESMQIFRQLSQVEVEVRTREESLRRPEELKTALKTENWQELKAASGTTA